MKLHHIGIAVENIEKYYNKILKPLMGFYTISETMEVQAQNVRAAFATNNEMVRIELIEAIDDTSPTSKIISRKAGGIYHLGFITDNFETDLALLKAQKFRLISNKNGIAYFLSPFFELFELMDSFTFNANLD